MKIITICGSIKFQNEMLCIARKMTLEGNIVITPIFPVDKSSNVTPSEKEIFDKVHKEKIKLAYAILVVDVDKYIGKSTKNEIEFAKYLNKEIMISNLIVFIAVM